MNAPHPLLEQLAGERQTRGLTQAATGARIGFSRRTISHWESGTRQPTLDDVEMYAAALGFRLTAVPLEQPADDTDDDPGQQLPFGELITDPAEKFCRGCQQTRPLRQFYKDRSRHDGYTSRCKFCVTERVERNEARRAGLEAHSLGEGAA